MGEGESLRAICADDHLPAESTVRNWAIRDVEGFFAQYAHATVVRAYRWADEITDIADTGNEGDTQRAKLRVDTRKWHLSKVLPKVYGEKMTLAGDSEAPLHVSVTRTIVRPDDEG
jgi:hypothetical protein